jgi:hypothetical protein
MFLLDGKPLSLDRAFTHNGLQYPANWLRLASPAERTALGITEAPDAPSYDQRFYWGPGLPKQLNDEPEVDENGVATGRITTGLKAQYIQQQKDIAASRLAPTDWYVIRHIEHDGAPDCACPPEVGAYRSAIRAASNIREQEVAAVSTVEELVELLNGQPTITDPEGGDPIPNPGLYLTPWPDDISI